jgi:putative MFS transporter
MTNLSPSQRLTTLLNESLLKAIQRWLWVLSTGGTLLDGFVIFVLGVAMPLIIAEFHLTPDVVGLIGASLVFGAVFGAGLMIADRLSSSPAGAGHIPLVFVGFIVFNLLMNAGPNSTTFTLAPILFPTQVRATASGFAAGVAKIGASLGVFVLPILKGKFGVPAVLGMMAAVSVLGLVVTLVYRHEDTED